MVIKKTNFEVGQVVTCQFGKASIPYGFKPFVEVEILDKREHSGVMLYLVKRRNMNMIATAVVPLEEVCGDLQTNLVVGYGDSISQEEAVKGIW